MHTHSRTAARNQTGRSTPKIIAVTTLIAIAAFIGVALWTGEGDCADRWQVCTDPARGGAK